MSTAEFSVTGDELARLVGDGVGSVESLVRTTYGPQGLDKMIQLNGEKNEVIVELASSGHAVLDAIERGDGFSHPVAAVVVDAVDTMYRDLRDGTTAAVVLMAALVDRGHDLVDEGLTPADVVVGYALGAQVVGEVFDDLARPVSHEDTDLLECVARTMLTCRLGDGPAAQYAERVVGAVTGVATETDGTWVDTTRVKVISDPGAKTDLHQGVIVTRWPRGAQRYERSLVEFDWRSQFPDPLTDATVAILDDDIEIEEGATNFGAGEYPGVQLDSSEAVERYQEGLKARRRSVATRVADLGVDVLVSQPRVDDEMVTAFEDAGVAVVDKVETPEADIDRLAAATGATVVSRPEDLDESCLGTADRVFEHRATEEKWTRFTGTAGHVYTLTLRTPTEHNADHVESVVEDALDVTATAVIDGQVVPGAGAPQMTAAGAIRDEAAGVGGPEALAMSAFGAALEDSVRVLVANAGLDPIDAITGLRNARADDDGEAVGLDVTSGERVDAWTAGIVDPRRVPSQAIETARTTAVRLLTTDAFLHPNVSLEEFSPETERQ